MKEGYKSENKPVPQFALQEAKEVKLNQLFQAIYHMKKPGLALALSSAPASRPAFRPSSSEKLHIRVVWSTCIGEEAVTYTSWQPFDTADSWQGITTILISRS
jgi:hypothetical protein